MRPLFPLVSLLILSVVPACVCSREETTSTVAPEPSMTTGPVGSVLRRPPLMASLRPAFNGRMPLILPDGGIRTPVRPTGAAGATP